ncbi:sterol desaturase family protein [Acinetobacter radioresistens]|uniref:sterol desaturase family protein n=1 Tax=Acinetobacter radioresistens TaxID=40216 RepID=UPI000E71C795|nr:sterol desaturase family protein [Acinetobacter radioresistens]MCK4107711.1 hypothetical protein [Acinetobacter radioresistens]RJL68992.1 hypothetical protein D5055_14450 [Acinetobacter radioresistens]
MWKGFVAGLIVANAFEWVAHKYILHGTHRAGKPRYSPVPDSMKSHWEHHKIVRKTEFFDQGYIEGIKNWRTRNELISLGAVATATSLMFYPISKGMALAAWYSAINYFYTHRKAHLEPEWAMKVIPWHYDHHMNANQDANWCVTKPWFDYIMGTRIISAQDLQEKNPLGIALPEPLSKSLQKIAGRYFPAQYIQAGIAESENKSIYLTETEQGA